MRRPNMRSTLFRRAPLGSLFLLCLATAGSTTRIAAQDAGTPPADTHDDDGFNEGLLGLVGLAGLLGLKRRDRDEVKRGEVNRNDVSRGATSRV
jgi:MYXO-CTERM domain-containing protein